MKSKRVALFFSACVLPGSGHWYLGLRKLGAAIAAVTLIAILYPMADTAASVTDQLHAIPQESLQDPQEIAAALLEARPDSSTNYTRSLYFALFCWIGAFVDIARRRIP